MGKRRNERQEKRQEEHTKRVELRQHTKETAYQNGIDPNQAWSSTVSSGLQSASGALSAIYGFGNKPGSRDGDTYGKGCMGALALMISFAGGMTYLLYEGCHYLYHLLI